MIRNSIAIALMVAVGAEAIPPVPSKPAAFPTGTIKVPEGELRITIPTPFIYRERNDGQFMGDTRVISVMCQFFDTGGKEIEATEDMWTANGVPQKVHYRADGKVIVASENKEALWAVAPGLERVRHFG